MAATYEPIASTTVSAVSSHTFSSIAADWTDLLITYALTSDTSSNDIFARFNSDSGTNYSHTRMWGNGSSALSDRGSNTNRLYVDASGYPSNDGRIAASTIQVMSYANTSVYKTVLSATGTAAGGVDRVVSLWRSTAAITAIQLFPAGGTMTGTLALYGIKAAANG